MPNVIFQSTDVDPDQDIYLPSPHKLNFATGADGGQGNTILTYYQNKLAALGNPALVTPEFDITDYSQIEIETNTSPWATSHGLSKNWMILNRDGSVHFYGSNPSGLVTGYTTPINPVDVYEAVNGTVADDNTTYFVYPTVDPSVPHIGFIHVSPYQAITNVTLRDAKIHDTGNVTLMYFRVVSTSSNAPFWDVCIEMGDNYIYINGYSGGGWSYTKKVLNWASYNEATTTWETTLFAGINNRDYYYVGLNGYVDVGLSMYSVAGTISEDLSIKNWLIRTFAHGTGQAYNKAYIDTSVSPDYQLTFANPYPLSIVCEPVMSMWASNTAYSAGDIIYTKAPTNIPYYFEALNSGSSGSSEPTWDVSENGQTVDNTVTWVRRDHLVRPQIHGPIVPFVVV